MEAVRKAAHKRAPDLELPMITTRQTRFAPVRPALVARAPELGETGDQYLALGDDGGMTGVDVSSAAIAFRSMREVARMAFRLPSTRKAHGLPRNSEITLRNNLH